MKSIEEAARCIMTGCVGGGEGGAEAERGGGGEGGGGGDARSYSFIQDTQLLSSNDEIIFFSVSTNSFSSHWAKYSAVKPLAARLSVSFRRAHYGETFEDTNRGIRATIPSAPYLSFFLTVARPLPPTFTML
ncbi:hypothetical protein E2C01_089381 [Portunus trituberculatus]|uniref:Uncharacterized protein n=1 Tax=Portunus trituberculatus TaxID=210409 RepID=A0A5B7JIN9_PORTR|nr:hypothetical protein [Portunus trituberculatus]